MDTSSLILFVYIARLDAQRQLSFSYTILQPRRISFCEVRGHLSRKVHWTRRSSHRSYNCLPDRHSSCVKVIAGQDRASLTAVSLTQAPWRARCILGFRSWRDRVLYIYKSVERWREKKILYDCEKDRGEGLYLDKVHERGNLIK